MKTALLLLTSLVFQAGPGLLPPRRPLSTVNFYIATTGDDSHVCSSASKCLTLAHVLTLVPQTLDRQYVINVADGTYAEPIDTSGFIGAGMGSLPSGGGTHTTFIEILGNISTPANVVFTGSVNCDSAFAATGCISGSAKVILEGLSITTGNRNGLECQNGVVELNKVNITQTGGPSLNGVTFLGFGCRWNMESDLTISGFDAPNPVPTGGIGIEMSGGSVGTIDAGTLTIIGPGTGNGGDGTTCITLDAGANSLVVTSFAGATVINCSNVNAGIWINENSVFTAAGPTDIILSQAATPTSSRAIQTFGQGVFYAGFGANLTVNNWTICYYANDNSLITQGRDGGTRTSTNCGTVSTPNDGSRIVLF